MAMEKVESAGDFAELEKKANLVVLHFMADWAPQCTQMNEVLIELMKTKSMNEVIFATILAEEMTEVSLRFEVTAVPTFILLRQGKVLERVEGANGAALTAAIETQAAKYSLTPIPPSTPKEDINVRLKKLINANKAMVFIKGSPDNPQCGFSRTTIQLLGKHKAVYGYFDILSDEEVRQGLKKYSNWPTYPQLYIDGELIGGLDILQEMDSAGELQSILPQKVTINERLKNLINGSPLMVFMKGNRNEPKCGFSRQLMAILNETSEPFETFDILTDEEVRQELKIFSNWPTYPQVYVKGDLIGGLDIIKDLKEDGSLLSTLKGE